MLNQRLTFAKGVADELFPAEADLEKAIVHASRLTIALVEGRKAAKQPITMGQDGLGPHGARQRRNWSRHAEIWARHTRHFVRPKMSSAWSIVRRLLGLSAVEGRGASRRDCGRRVGGSRDLIMGLGRSVITAINSRSREEEQDKGAGSRTIYCRRCVGI